VCLNDQSRGVGLPVEKLNCNIWWYDNFLLPAGLCVVQPCRYCFYSEVQKWIFRRAGVTHCPDKREIWHIGPLPLWRKFIPKITIFGDIGGPLSPHLLSQNGKIWREGANLEDSPHAKFCKNWLRGYTPLWQNYTKN